MEAAFAVVDCFIQGNAVGLYVHSVCDGPTAVCRHRLQLEHIMFPPC